MKLVFDGQREMFRVDLEGGGEASQEIVDACVEAGAVSAHGHLHLRYQGDKEGRFVTRLELRQHLEGRAARAVRHADSCMRNAQTWRNVGREETYRCTCHVSKASRMRTRGTIRGL